MHVEMSQATKGWQCYAAVSSSNWKLHFIYQGKVETFLALLYKLYFICVPGTLSVRLQNHMLTCSMVLISKCISYDIVQDE